jgi:hypothetical protein
VPDGVVTTGVVIGGVVTAGVVTGGTVTGGTVTDGVVAAGVETVGTTTGRASCPGSGGTVAALPVNGVSASAASRPATAAGKIGRMRIWPITLQRAETCALRRL